MLSLKCPYVVHNLSLYSFTIPAHFRDRSTSSAPAMVTVPEEEDKLSDPMNTV